jgi:hypothetical protein
MNSPNPARFDPPEPALSEWVTIGWGISPSGRREARCACPLCGARVAVECDSGYIVNPAGVAKLKAHACEKEDSNGL